MIPYPTVTLEGQVFLVSVNLDMDEYRIQLKFFLYIYSFYTFNCLACAYVGTLHACRMPIEARRESWIPWD